MPTMGTAVGARLSRSLCLNSRSSAIRFVGLKMNTLQICVAAQKVTVKKTDMGDFHLSLMINNSNFVCKFVS